MLFFGVTCVFPIDLVKTRLQSQQVLSGGSAQYFGIIDCARKTWRSGGPGLFPKVRSIYSGSAVSILFITPEKAIKLVANDVFRKKLSASNERKLPIWKGMISGAGAGLCQVVVTTPMELLKIQKQQSGPGMTASRITLNLLKDKGVFGLYRGVRPTMARDVSFSVIYFPLFAALDSLGPRKSDGSGDAVFYTSFVAGLFSGAFASLTVTPLDVIKTRIQLIGGRSETGTTDYSNQYRGIVDAFRKILSQEGSKALFKGALCRMLVMAPLFGIAQTVYYFGVAEYILGINKVAHI